MEFLGGENYIKKVAYGKDINYGLCYGSFECFDDLGIRKCAFERQPKDKIVKRIVKSKSKKKAVDSKPVKVYKKKTKNSTNKIKKKGGR